MLLKNKIINKFYDIINIIEKGGFGIVYKARNKKTKESVAIKEINKKYKNYKDILFNSELIFLKKFKHKNIINFKETFYLENKLIIVFEYFEYDLYKFYFKLKKENKKLNNEQISRIVYQIVLALNFLHCNYIIHRDLKPENILINDNWEVKLCDFGLVKEEDSKTPFTDYISTRWYRSPELLLKNKKYNCKMDIFSLGCIIAEWFLFKPLFPGENEFEQWILIFNFLGKPSNNFIKENKILKKIKNLNNDINLRNNLKLILPDANENSIDLIEKCLAYDSKKRISSYDILDHPFLKLDKKNIDIKSTIFKNTTLKYSHLKNDSFIDSKNINFKESINHTVLKKSKTFFNLNQFFLNKKSQKNNIFKEFVKNYSKKIISNKRNTDYCPIKLNYCNLIPKKNE